MCPRTHAEQCSLSQTKNKPNAHQQEDGESSCVLSMQWNVTKSAIGREKRSMHVISRMNLRDSEEWKEAQ